MATKSAGLPTRPLITPPDSTGLVAGLYVRKSTRQEHAEVLGIVVLDPATEPGRPWLPELGAVHRVAFEPTFSF